jgi:hypothetical protein
VSGFLSNECIKYIKENSLIYFTVATAGSFRIAHLKKKKLLNAPSIASPLTSLGRRRTSLPQLRRNEQAFITTHPHPRALPPLWQLCRPSSFISEAGANPLFIKNVKNRSSNRS